jgi:integrase
MALIKPAKAGGDWGIDISVPASLQHLHGARVRHSAGTADRKLATQYHDTVKADLWRQEHLSEKAPRTIKEAVDRWDKTNRHLRAFDDRKRQLLWWEQKLGPDRQLKTITRGDIMAAVEGLKARSGRGHTGTKSEASAGTVNRYLAAIRALLRTCHREWEWIDSAPAVTLRKEPRGRTTFLTVEQLQALYAALPEWWRPLMTFSLATGLRQANVLRLRWAQVDLARQRMEVEASEFKNGHDFGLPLNDTAIAVLRSQLGNHAEFVFTYRGNPMTELSHHTWSAALKRAGLEGVRWHDLRHTFATHYLMAGGDLDSLQKLGGWQSRAMVLRYAHFTTGVLRPHSQLLDKAFGGLIPQTGAVTADSCQQAA